MMIIPSFHSNSCIWKIFNRSHYHSPCWKGNNQHLLQFLDKGPFTSWPLMNAAVSLCSEFSFVLCLLLPSHTNTTPFDKPQPGPFVSVHTNTQRIQCTLLPFWQICSLHLGDVEMTQLFRHTGRVTENIPACCQQPALGAADSPAWHGWREVSKLAALLPFALTRVMLGNCS